MKYVYTKKIKGRSKNKHHKSKKINKYKHKSKNKQNKNRSKKILKGGGKSSASASTLASEKIKPVIVSSTLPERKYSRLVKTPEITSSFKTPQKTIFDKMKENKEKKIIEQQMKVDIETLINSFFEKQKWQKKQPL